MHTVREMRGIMPHQRYSPRESPNDGRKQMYLLHEMYRRLSSKCEKNKSTEIISIYSGFQGKNAKQEKNRNYLYNKTTTLIKRQIQDYFRSNVQARSGSPLPRKNKYRRGEIFCFLEYNESSPLSSFSHISRLS